MILEFRLILLNYFINNIKFQKAKKEVDACLLLFWLNNNIINNWYRQILVLVIFFVYVVYNGYIALFKDFYL
jgi:hypothetical protein